MLSDILIAVGIGAVILGLIYAIFSSARTAQKGNAPVSEHAVSNKSSKKQQQQQKSDDEEESSVPAKKNNNNNTSTTTNNTKQRSTSPKKKSASPAGSSASSNNNTTATKKADNKKADKKAAKKAREEEEAELDAIVEAEMKRSLATGIRKEKFEVINLDTVHKVKENKAARQEKKSEGASFNEKQIASEKAAGFRVVGAQEAAKKEAQQHTAATAKSSSPASRGGEGKKSKSNNNGGGAMTREEELDLALRSVLSKRGGNKRGGDAGAFRPRREENSPEDERGFVELKGEIKASTPGGAWVRK